MVGSNWLSTRLRINDWLGTRHRPASVGALIGEKPVSITVSRIDPSNPTSESNLSAQVVRLDTLSDTAQTSMLFGDVGMTNKQMMVLIGYKGHPTVADTNIRDGDRFVAYDQRFYVKKVQASFTDRVLALCEAEL